MDLCFVAHGNANIGMGHVMRSLALAEAFRENGHAVSFFSKYKSGVSAVKDRGFRVAEYGSWPEEKKEAGFCYGDEDELCEDLKWIASGMSGIWDVMVVDSYNVSQMFFTELKKYTKCLAYIDDVNVFTYPVDVIVNGTASAESMGYDKLQQARLLLGIRYNLLRREFCGLPKRKENRGIQNVLITTGNSDPFHMTEKLLKLLLKEIDLAKLRYHVIVGGGFEETFWSDSVINHENVFLYHKPEKMVEIMEKCDIAVTAGGSTLYELAACGIPTVAFAYAENQKPQMKALSDMGLLACAGTYMDLKCEVIISFIRRMSNSTDIYMALTQRLQGLLDGKGAQRVMREIEEICGGVVGK